jgi:hypothetical protein
LEILIVIVIVFFIWFAIHMWSEESKNGAMIRARDNFVTRLDERLRRQLLDEPVFANTDEELIDNFKSYLSAFSESFGFDASRNGEVELLAEGLKRIDEGDLGCLQTVITRLRLDNSAELASTLDKCHQVVSEKIAENDVLKALLVDCNKAYSDSMSEILKMVQWSESKDGALEEIQGNVYALVLCVYRFILQYSSDERIKFSTERSQFDSMVESSNDSAMSLANRLWPQYKSALIEDQKLKQKRKFSHKVEDVFCESVKLRPIVGFEYENKELLARSCSIVLDKSLSKGKKSIAYLQKNNGEQGTEAEMVDEGENYPASSGGTAEYETVTKEFQIDTGKSKINIRAMQDGAGSSPMGDKYKTAVVFMYSIEGRNDAGAVSIEYESTERAIEVFIVNL